MASTDESFLRARRFQLSLRQRRRASEELLVATNLRGDYLLAPAYDLLNTSIHVMDEDFALQSGLIPEAEYSDVYTRTGHPCRADFETFGRRIGALPKKMTEILDLFVQEQPEVYALIDRSFLDERVKRMYKRSYQERLSRLRREE